MILDTKLNVKNVYIDIMMLDTKLTVKKCIYSRQKYDVKRHFAK